MRTSKYELRWGPVNFSHDKAFSALFRACLCISPLEKENTYEQHCRAVAKYPVQRAMEDLWLYP
jgi:hypothetical protein